MTTTTTTTPDAITIRHGEPRDIAQVHAIYADPVAQANTFQLPNPPLAYWEQRLAPGQDGFWWFVAVRGDEVLGQLGLSVQQRPRRRHVATFGMGVKASARGQGVGSRLVASAIDAAERWHDVSRLECEVYVDNAAAIALYRRHGFQIEGTMRRYALRDGVYVDAHVMARLREDVSSR